MNDVKAYNVNKAIERLGYKVVELIYNDEAITYNDIINDESVRGHLLDLIKSTKELKEDK